MKLADILAIKKKLRCPACQSKLDWQKKRLLVATGRCPCCATKIIEDLPPLPETPLVDPNALHSRMSWLEIACAIPLFAFLLAGIWCFGAFAGDPAGTANPFGLMMTFLLFFLFVWILNKLFSKGKPKCPGCGDVFFQVQISLLKATGRCGECGAGLLNVAPPKGTPAMPLEEYFRRKARIGWTDLTTVLILVILYGIIGFGMLLLPPICWLIPLLSLIVLFAPLPWVGKIKKTSISCPDCGRNHSCQHPPQFLQSCAKCGRHLVDLDSGDNVALYRHYRRIARQSVWWLIIGIAGALALLVVLLRVIPFDCGPVNDAADLKPSPSLEVAAADNAWTYFVPAWQEVDNDNDWPSTSERKKMDLADIEALLKRHQPALESLDKGLACKICQAPPVSGFLEKQSRPRIPTTGIVDLQKLRLEMERRQGRPDTAMTMALKMYRYGLLLRDRAEDRRQYQSGHYASHQALLELRRLASEPVMPPESLATAEHELRPGSAMAFWAMGLDHMLRKEYVLMCDFLRGIPADLRYLEGCRVSRSGDFFLAQFNFLYQPNRTQRDLARHWRQVLASPNKSASPIYGEEDWYALRMHGREFLFNGFGKAILAWDAYETVGREDYYYDDGGGRVHMWTPKHEYMPAEVVLTRALLLCRLYEKKHGQLPETLQELVPEFVEAVPLDPFDGQPVRYSKERQIVYCVGSDGKDDGAPKYEKGWGPQGEYNRLRDQVLELKPKAKEKVDR